MHPGNDDSTTNTLEHPDRHVDGRRYAGTTAQWTQVVDCVKQTYAPFDVQIVTSARPRGNYHMAIVAGHARRRAVQGRASLGVSPFSCGYIPNAISFSFANEDADNIDEICWTVAQETAHSWGLDHKFDNRDPMTYLRRVRRVKSFQNQAGSCGEYSARACSCQYAAPAAR